uniref:Uncharacterized protein n=1 Tax=Ananas comosus var. bracteatus TaxID=296719 RepID=A0A6V7Q099_ANACO|nr:unnamed protein product [Ananas comosus var. bracteatus]
MGKVSTTMVRMARVAAGMGRIGELERGHLHKAWIRLHHWPILYWNEKDIKVAVSGFGELWDISPLATRGSTSRSFEFISAAKMSKTFQSGVGNPLHPTTKPLDTTNLEMLAGLDFGFEIGPK